MNQASPGGNEAGCAAVADDSVVSSDTDEVNVMYQQNESAVDSQDYPSSGNPGYGLPEFETRQLSIDVVSKAQR